MQNSSEWILMTSVHGGHVEGVNDNTKINYLHENKTFFQRGIVLLFCSSNKAVVYISYQIAVKQEFVYKP